MNEIPLRDIHLPNTAISWWPPAIGWWMLALLVLGVLGYLLRPTLRKRASKFFRKIEKGFHKTGDAKRCVEELSLLLRWIAVKKDKNYAGLTGSKWLKCLDAQLKAPEFSQGIGKLLITAPYQKSVEEEHVSELLSLTKKVVRRL